MSEQNDFLTDFSTNFFTNFSQEFSDADMSAYTPPTLTPEEEEAIINKEWSKVPPVSELFKEETEPQKKENTLNKEYNEFLENLNTRQKCKEIEEQKRIIAEHKKKYKKYLDEDKPYNDIMPLSINEPEISPYSTYPRVDMALELIYSQINAESRHKAESIGCCISGKSLIPVSWSKAEIAELNRRLKRK
mgnify:CR=1 FL=1